MNEQREIIYAERKRVLDGESMHESILDMIDTVTSNLVDYLIPSDVKPEEWDMISFNEQYRAIFPVEEPVYLDPEERYALDKEKLKEELTEKGRELYAKKEAEFPEPEHFTELERVVLLKVIDRHWMNHIDDMDQLRQGIGLAAYGQKNPVVEYKIQGFDMFKDMTASIQEDTVKVMLHIRIEEKVEREQVAKPIATNKDDSIQKGPKTRSEKKVGRNDPCPCGSGKKYKHCCGRNA